MKSKLMFVTLVAAAAFSASAAMAVPSAVSEQAQALSAANGATVIFAREAESRGRAR